MNITALDELRSKLKALRIEHRQLDQEIQTLGEQLSVDHLQLRRLKKRKLDLKEAIVKAESQLIPDLNA